MRAETGAGSQVLPRTRGAWTAALLAGLVAAGVVAAALRPPLRLEPGSQTWRRSLRGVTVKGLLAGQGGLLLPGLSRAAAGELRLEVEPASKAATALLVRVDGAASVSLPADARTPLRLSLPAQPTGGLRLDLAPVGGPLRLRSIEIVPGTTPMGAPLVAALGAAALAFARRRAGRTRSGVGLALVAGALVALAASFPLAWAVWPQSASSLAPALLAGAVGLALGWRTERRAFAADVGLVAAFVFGAAVRLLFLHSTGSWDTEYWKAWMHRSVEAGVTGAYGPPEALPLGRALAQLRGQQELWKVERGGRAFVVDYAPLSMALWALSDKAVALAAPRLSALERDNVAVKLPALLGDLLSLVVLVWICGPDRRRGLALAALYWALPVSWLSSAVLGYFDGILPPLLVVSLVLAARGRAAGAGAWLSLAVLVKPTALIVAPALAAALWLSPDGASPGDRRRAALRALGRATLGGLAVTVVVFLPFARDGTLGTALVHCARIVFQERLSGGYPNLWWLVGHALTAGASGAWPGPVAFAPVGLLPFPARAAGTLLFALAAVHVVRWQRAGARAACLAGALLFLAYGMLGVGVHENHPHPLFLMLLAAGLPTRRLRLVAAGAATVYVLDMLALSGLGRFHGPRYLWLLPAAEAADSLRMASGVDLTLLLVPLHLVVFAAALAGARDDVQSLEPPGDRTFSPPNVER